MMKKFLTYITEIQFFLICAYNCHTFCSYIDDWCYQWASNSFSGFTTAQTLKIVRLKTTNYSLALDMYLCQKVVGTIIEYVVVSISKENCI